MGADLIITGFTVKNGPLPNRDQVLGALTAIVEDSAFWEAQAGLRLHYLVDERFPMPGDDWLPDDIARGRQDILDSLTEGFNEYEHLLTDSTRYSVIWPINDERTFITAGGTSGGDDPFEAWGQLDLFLEVAAQRPVLAELIGFCGWGVEPG